MKHPALDWISGLLLSAILFLGVVAGWLTYSIADREIRLHSTPAQWNTATFQPERPAYINPPDPIPSATLLPTFPLWTPTPTPDFDMPASSTLPASHPTPGPDQQSCGACHQTIHGGGG